MRFGDMVARGTLRTRGIDGPTSMQCCIAQARMSTYVRHLPSMAGAHLPPSCGRRASTRCTRSTSRRRAGCTARGGALAAGWG